MNPARLLTHFHRLADAPDAVPLLRRFILDLALRGKLVTKALSPDRAPAWRAFCDELDNRVYGYDPGPPPPFEVPEHWRWSVLDEAADCRAGAKVAPKEITDDAWVLDLEDIDGGVGKVINFAKFSDRRSLSTKAGFEVGDVLYGKLRPYLNKVVVAEAAGFCTTEIIPIRPKPFLVAGFLRLFLRSPHFLHYAERRNYGMKMPRLGTKDLESADVPVPPPEEQRRIVAKVEELMELCDRLEAAQAEREKRRDRLAGASVQRVNQHTAADPQTFREHARFHLRHLPRLTVRPDQIPALRQTILNLAVRGQLVPQDPKDEPAAELLRRIHTEKAGLGTRQQPRMERSNGSSGAYPTTWVAPKLSEISSLVTSGSRGWAEYYSTSGAKFIRAQNIRFGKLRLTDLACVNPPKKSEGARTQVSKGDLILVITGAGVTNPAMLDQDLGEAYVSQHVALVRPTTTEITRWVLLCMMAPAAARAALLERAYGAGKPGLNLEHIRTLLIPLPPLAEQDRIVAKVDELMALCDRLEAQLTTTKTESRRLLETVLHEALAPLHVTTETR